MSMGSRSDEGIMSTLKQRRAARVAYKRAKKKPLGEGSRFKAVQRAAKLGGARNPAAVAAAVGRKKYGKKRFQKLAAKGRKAS